MVSLGAEKIAFGRPTLVGRELDFIARAIEKGSIAGGGFYSRSCEEWLERQLACSRVLLTHSCTAALEMAAILTEVGPGDEVIMPSFTFSSTATAFVLRGATPVFVDICPATLNIDIEQIEKAVTSRTKIVVPVHYAGLACEMDSVMDIARRRQLFVVEDAAQAHLSHYKGRALGAIGHLGCLSFHETKNIISGEGGALIVNEPALQERAEIIREKGTDRSKFFRGEIDKYTWIDLGSSYSPSEIVGAFLYAQLEQAESICRRRREIFDRYLQGLADVAATGAIVLPPVAGVQTNGHIFWTLVRDGLRDKLISYLWKSGIHAVFHYVPLHSAPAGRKYGRQSGELAVTDRVSAELVRLPMHLGLTNSDVDRVVSSIYDFFNNPAL